MRLAALGWLLLGAAAAAQASPGSRPHTPTPEAAYAALTAELEVHADRGERLVLLREFVAAYAAKHATSTPVGLARCRLGSELLTAFDPSGARAAFEDAIDHAPADAIDIRGRALYGVAQAHELAGDLRLARGALDRAVDEVRGTRYARFARLARLRLDRERAIAIGVPLPEFGPRLDLAGKSRQLADLAGMPGLVAFVSLADDDGLEEFGELLEVFERAGLDAEQVLVFAFDTDDRAARATAEREEWRASVITCDREFLDDAALLYAVRALPACYLIGPDGALLAREPTARRATEIVGALR